MKPECETLAPRWDGPIIVAATGTSLTKAVAAACKESGYPVIAVKQAALRMPWAPVMYACDAHHWDTYQGYRDFQGERWSSHDPSMNNKLEAAKKYGLRLIRGDKKPGFSPDPSVIHYGQNSGFQAIGMAIHWLHGPRKRIVLVGFDMHGGYFFGDHPRGQRFGKQFSVFVPLYDQAAKSLPAGVEIVNCSPQSALKCFPCADLATALAA